jgi:dihydrofolate synthase / folylpolyglutamate synthase
VIVTPVKTRKVLAGQGSLEELLDESLDKLSEKSIVAITSKVVGICEGRVVPVGSVEKEALVKQESDFFLNPKLSKHQMSFTITHNTLVPVAGIDESNGNGNYILWPKNPQESANRVREYLSKRFRLKNVGVVITDSTVRPLHYGTEGVAIAFSGFMPMNDYIGQPDLFGRPFKVSKSNLPDALASTAVLVMGEGTEQTPIAIIKDLPFIKFLSRNPIPAELKSFYLDHMEDDLFAPFLKNAPWQKGGRDGN